MSKAFRLFPEIDVTDWYVPIEKVEKKDSPYMLEKAKKRAIKIAKQLEYIKLFPNLEMEINSADKIDSITTCMERCRRAC